MIKVDKMPSVFAYLFIESPSSRKTGRMYHIGGLPPLTRDEAIKLADVANKMLDARSLHLVRSDEVIFTETEYPLYQLKIVGEN